MVSRVFIFAELTVGQRELNVLADLHHFSFVEFRNGVHDYEEGKEQSDEVRVRNEPTFVINVLFVWLLAPHFCFPASRRRSAARSRTFLSTFTCDFAITIHFETCLDNMCIMSRLNG